MYYTILDKLKENLKENFSTDHEDSNRGCVYLDFEFHDGSSMIADLDLMRCDYVFEYFDAYGEERQNGCNPETFEVRLCSDLEDYYWELATQHADADDEYETYHETYE